MPLKQPKAAHWWFKGEVHASVVCQNQYMLFKHNLIFFLIVFFATSRLSKVSVEVRVLQMVHPTLCGSNWAKIIWRPHRTLARQQTNDFHRSVTPLQEQVVRKPSSKQRRKRVLSTERTITYISVKTGKLIGNITSNAKFLIEVFCLFNCGSLWNSPMF